MVHLETKRQNYNIKLHKDAMPYHAQAYILFLKFMSKPYDMKSIGYANLEY